MLFPLRLDFGSSQTAIPLGGTATFEITREFHLEELWVELAFTPTAAFATANPDGINSLLKRVVLSVSDGARTRNVIDCSGAGLLEYYKQLNGQLDYDTQTNLFTAPASGAKIMRYPLFFSMPNVDDPVTSMLLLPAPRFNANPVLRLDFATQADMDVNVTPTFAISSGITARLIFKRRTVLAKSWPTFDCELLETVVPYTASGRQAYELQSPGSYTGILLRCYTSTSARGDVMTAGGDFSLSLLGTNLRRFRLLDIQFQNELSLNPGSAATGITGILNGKGSYFLDFLSDHNGAQAGEFGSVLDANLPVTTGARLRLLQDITGGAGVQIKYIGHRIYGVLDSLKMLSKLGGKVKSV